VEAVENLIEPGLGQSQGWEASSKRAAVFTPPNAALSMHGAHCVIQSQMLLSPGGFYGLQLAASN
jgi:hypothetical protein